MRYIYEGGCLQNGRPTNMDSLLLRERRINGQSALIAIVCDGVGSTKDGAYASSTAVSLLNQWFSSAVTCERLGLRLRDKVIEINAQIAGIGKRDGLDTASTLSLVALVEDKYYIVHIGDSRIYSIGNGSVSMLTHDDVSETGKLSGYIGRAPDINLFYDEGEATGKAFAICSDGLVGHWGGRYIWQHSESYDFRIYWYVCKDDENPVELEKKLLEEFVIEYQRLPFANLIK